MANTIHRPMPDSVFTVRELIEILSTADPDAVVISGRNMDDCEDNIEQIIIGDNIVAFLTQPDTVDDANEDDQNDDKLWYAVVRRDDYPDWGTGSYNKDEAMQMARDYGPDRYVAVIDESGREPMCIGEIDPNEEV